MDQRDKVFQRQALRDELRNDRKCQQIWMVQVLHTCLQASWKAVASEQITTSNLASRRDVSLPGHCQELDVMPSHMKLSLPVNRNGSLQARIRACQSCVGRASSAKPNG